MTFPRNIHFIWLPSLDDCPEDRRANPQAWEDLNPGWSVWKWDESGIIPFLEDNHPDLKDTFLECGNSVMRSDMARLLILELYGGVYVDYDMVPITPLDRFITDDMCAYNTVMCKEQFDIDGAGYGVSNGVIFHKPDHGWLRAFVHQQRNAYHGLVLDFCGTWAITRHVRTHAHKLRRGALKLIRPELCLWNPGHFNCPLPDAALCRHPFVNTWGDHSQQNWWRV